MNTLNRAAAMPEPANWGWLRNASFDLTFIVGVAIISLVSGLIVVLKPSLFEFILFLDLWFLGYQHVVATFTRLSFDSESFKQYRFLVIWLPFIIAFGATAAFLLLGPWVLATTYLYWQWFHYTRQSYGISRIYQCKIDPRNSWIDKSALYLIPLTGILFRSFQRPARFLDMELKVLYVPEILMKLLFLLSAAILILWTFKQMTAIRNRQSSLAYTLYMISHFTVFTFGYVLIDHINHGWLVINVWHNAQYILFVWMYNNKRFRNTVNERHRFLSTLSLAKNQWMYYVTCFSIASFVYVGLENITALFKTSTLPLALVVYQTINFHHYVVDGIIWKVRQKPIRNTLEIKGA